MVAADPQCAMQEQLVGRRALGGPRRRGLRQARARRAGQGRRGSHCSHCTAAALHCSRAAVHSANRHCCSHAAHMQSPGRSCLGTKPHWQRRAGALPTRWQLRRGPLRETARPRRLEGSPWSVLQRAAHRTRGRRLRCYMSLEQNVYIPCAAAVVVLWSRVGGCSLNHCPAPQPRRGSYTYTSLGRACWQQP